MLQREAKEKTEALQEKDLEKRPTLHLPDFQRGHVIGAFYQMFPQLL